MKKSNMFFLMIVALSFNGKGFGQLKQGEFLIRGGTEGGWGITATNDNGYCITGLVSIPDFAMGYGGVYAAKFDLNGALQWSKALGGGPPYSDDGCSIIQVKDKGYVIAGSTSNFNVNHNEKVYVIKLDSAGNLKWTQTIGGSSNEEGYAVAEADDGGYVITGWEESFGPGLSAVYIVKLDTAGNLKWTNAIGGANAEAGESIVCTSDKGFAIAGNTDSYGAAVGNNGDNVYVVKLDSIGNLKWTKTIGGTIDEEGWGITQTKDKGYAITGDSRSYGDTINGDVYVVKLDSLGNLRWAEAIGGAKWDGGRGIASTFDGGCVITGFTYSYGDTAGGKYSIYVIKLDTVGKVEWTRAIGNGAGSVGESIVQTKDSGYAITGVSDTALLFLKLDKHGNTCLPYDSGGIVTKGGIIGSGGGVSSGGSVQRGGTINNAGSIETTFCSVTGINNIPLLSINGISIYPNPNNGIFYLSLSNADANCSVEVYNILGEIVYTKILFQSQSNTIINLTGQPSGVYFYRVMEQDGGLVGSGKLVIE